MREIEKLLLQIYKIDKTPEYGYGQTEDCRTKEGETPKKGSRFQTPREIIRNYFNGSFWKKWNEFCEVENDE